jgi:hypothetical protein
MGERTLLEAALARLDDAALAVTSSAATDEEQHQILGCLVAAYSLLRALSRADPAAVDELLERAVQLRERVSRPKTGWAVPPRAGGDAGPSHGPRT